MELFSITVYKFCRNVSRETFLFLCFCINVSRETFTDLSTIFLLFLAKSFVSYRIMNYNNSNTFITYLNRKGVILNLIQS